MNLIKVNTNIGGDESVVSNVLQFVGIVATVYAAIHFVGEWKAVNNLLDLKASSYTTAATEASMIKHQPNSVQPIKDSKIFTLEALHTIPCNKEGTTADDNFMRIELPTDESCEAAARSKTVEL